MSPALLVVLVFIAGALLTGVVRRYAQATDMFDIPNERSSHTRPVPRGGGVAIVLAALGGLICAAATGIIDAPLVSAIGGGGGLVAAIGWIDDRRSVSPAVRAVIHVLAAVWAVSLLGGLPAIRLPWGVAQLGIVGHGLAIVGIVWLTNLYNFMDGIDGLAGGEGVVAGLLGAAMMGLMGFNELAICAAIVASACGGFLLWNWPPARIFMGDVGSGFLGFSFGVLALASEVRDALPFLSWLVLLGVFVVDSTVTLLRRIRHGEKWYAAHRSHAYQRAVQAGASHGQVTITALAVTLVLGAIVLLGELDEAFSWGASAVGTGILIGVYALVERVRPMYGSRHKGREAE